MSEKMDKVIKSSQSLGVEHYRIEIMNANRQWTNMQAENVTTGNGVFSAPCCNNHSQNINLNYKPKHQCKKCS